MEDKKEREDHERLVVIRKFADFMDRYRIPFKEMRELVATLSEPDLTISNVINLMESKPYFEEEEDYQERDMKYTPPDKTKGPSRVIDGFDVSPEDLQKLVEKKKRWKLDENRYEKYTHHDVEVWVRKDLKGKDREHCLCWNCIKFKNNEYVDRVVRDGFVLPWQGETEKPSDLWLERVAKVEGCPIANKLYECYCKYGVVAPVWECPDFENSSEVAEAFDIPVTGEYFEEGNKRSEIG